MLSQVLQYYLPYISVDGLDTENNKTKVATYIPRRYMES